MNWGGSESHPYHDGLTSRRGVFPLNPRSVAPQIFQAIEFAFVAMEDVHDDLQVIEHDPLARRETIDRRRACRVIFF